jgi:hypothetical protein
MGVVAQRFSPEIPWVAVAAVGPGTYLAECEVCGASASGDPGVVAAFGQAHQAHTANGYMGLGDAIAAVAKPIARAFGQEPCTPCEARRRALNEAARVRRWW